MATGIAQLRADLATNAARLEEVKRFGYVLQQRHRLHGAAGLHYDNRCQALELERTRLEKLIHKEEKEAATTKPLKNT